MSWADIKRRYESSGENASQSTEDMVARRILRACGVVESKLPAYERANGLDACRRGDTTLLERALAVSRVVSKALYSAPVVMDVKSFKEAEDAVMELSESNPGRSVVIYRKRGGREIRALTCLGSPECLYLNELPMPCRICMSRDGSAYLAECDAKDYIDRILRKESA